VSTLASPSFSAQSLPQAPAPRRIANPGRLALRVTGALALLAMAALHLQQYLDAGYSALPTIGTLFVLNFVGGVAIGGALLLPVERLPGRGGSAAVALLALIGAAMAAISIVFLLISEQTPLFGFLETSTSSAITVALIVESVATAALGALAAASVRSLPRGTEAPHGVAVKSG
jgi:hypothetical protein